MNFSSFLTRPGDRRDEEISNFIALRLPSWSKLMILPLHAVSLTIFNFSHDKTPNLMFFSEISF